MKRILLSAALLAMTFGASAQVGVKTVTSTTGTSTETSTEVTVQKSNHVTRADAEIIWHKAEEYGIGMNSFVMENGDVIVRWETNDTRVEYINTDGEVVWNFPTTADWPFMHTNKAGSLSVILENNTANFLDIDGNIINTINPGPLSNCVTRPDGEGAFLAYATSDTETTIAYYGKTASSAEWTTILPNNIVGMNIDEDQNRLIVTCAGTNTLFVLDPETGDVIQDDIYYYQNSPKQAPGLSKDGTYMAWGDFNGKGYLRKWNGEQYEEVWSANLSMPGESSCWGYGCAVSADGSTIALGTLGFIDSGYDGYVFVFENYSGTPIWSAQTDGPVNTIDICADGSLIAVASDGPMNHATSDLIIYRRESSTPLMGVNTPGSMNYVDITDDGAYATAAGKGCHSYEMGWGGNAYLIHSIPTYAGNLDGVITLNQVEDYSGALVTVEGLDSYYCYTNTDGEFNVKYIPAGTYDVTISKIGFISQTLSDVEINAGEATTIEATLEPVGSPIQNLYASKGSYNTVELRWDAYQESFEGYNIYRKDNINATFTEVLATVGTDETTFTDETAVPTITYYYAVTAALPGNAETPLSNVEEGYVSTAFLVETIEVYNGSAPTIDGTLSADEWNDAFKVDISDFTGITEGIDPVGSVYLYLKTDGDKLYMAIEDFLDTELSENDCLALYFDDNNDHSYPAQGNNDNSEGNYWFKYSGGTGILQYRPIYEGGAVGDVIDIQGAEVAFSSAAGHVTGEFVLEFGNEDHQITTGDNEESSVYMFYRSSGTEYHAYWPYNNIDTFDPIGYDTFKYFTDDETPEAPQNLRVDEDILGNRLYVPVRWDMPEMNDLSHFNVFVNSDEVAYTVNGAEVVLDVEENTDYAVYVTTVDNNGNESEQSETLTFHMGTVNVNEVSVFNVRVYPNPASSTIYIETELSGAATATITDIAGRLVSRINIADVQNSSINVESLESGMYFLTIQQDNNIIVRKINVQ